MTVASVPRMGGWIESVRRWRAAAKRDTPGYSATMAALGRVVEPADDTTPEPGGVGRSRS